MKNKNKQISLYVGIKTYNALKSYAQQKEIKIIELLRRIIQEFLRDEGIEL